jgi:hypothetical protein
MMNQTNEEEQSNNIQSEEHDRDMLQRLLMGDPSG